MGSPLICLEIMISGGKNPQLLKWCLLKNPRALLKCRLLGTGSRVGHDVVICILTKISGMS